MTTLCRKYCGCRHGFYTLGFFGLDLRHHAFCFEDIIIGIVHKSRDGLGGMGGSAKKSRNITKGGRGVGSARNSRSQVFTALL